MRANMVAQGARKQVSGKTHAEGYGWQTKGAKERNAILNVVRGCGKNNFSWKRTAAILDIHESTLIRWRKDDPQGKIDTAHEAGKAEAGKEIMGLMMDRARDAEAQGSSSVLIHLSRHLCDMSDRSTHSVVTPGDLAGDDASARHERRAVALDMLGLSALDRGTDGD